MKSLNIENSPVAQKIASIALFERIQKMFNLHPSKMVNDVKEMAKKRNRRPSELLGEMHGPVQRLFRETLALIRLNLEGQECAHQAYPQHTRDFIEYFNLNPWELAEAMKKKATLEGYDAIEAAAWLDQNHWQVLEWAFAETMRVLMKEEDEAA